jgi:hypothetical protein
MAAVTTENLFIEAAWLFFTRQTTKGGDRKMEDNQQKKKTASYHYKKNGVVLEFVININFYNTNHNNNNLANQRGQAGVTMTATENSQISGDHGKNTSGNEEKDNEDKNKQMEDQKEIITLDLSIHDGFDGTTESISESFQKSDSDNET